MLQERIVELLASNWIAVVVLALAAGMAMGWMIGNRRGRRQAGSGQASDQAYRLNAGRDFKEISRNAHKIAKLAMEIADRAGRSEDTVKPELSSRARAGRRFEPPAPRDPSPGHRHG